jgi:hypothetical protein
MTLKPGSVATVMTLLPQCGLMLTIAYLETVPRIAHSCMMPSMR